MIPNKFNNHPSILQATPLHIEGGMMPYRYVLREFKQLSTQVYPGEPWVVHRENMTLSGETWEHVEFYWGHYFTTKDAAEKYFEERRRGNH